MIEGKTALQTMVTIFLSFGPFLILFTAIYFSNDILVRDRKQTTTVQGLPVSWYRYLNTKSVVAFSYTVVVLIALMTLTNRKSTRLNSSHVAISYAVFCF